MLTGSAEGTCRVVTKTSFKTHTKGMLNCFLRFASTDLASGIAHNRDGRWGSPDTDRWISLDVISILDMVNMKLSMPSLQEPHQWSGVRLCLPSGASSSWHLQRPQLQCFTHCMSRCGSQLSAFSEFIVRRLFLAFTCAALLVVPEPSILSPPPPSPSPPPSPWCPQAY